jgi:outer membrane protein insertion porin family
MCLAMAAAGVLAAVLGPASAQDQQSGRNDVIAAIRVEGNQRIEDATVISYMKVVAGDRFDPERINESLKSLFETGLFADVAMAREGNTLVVRVVENPIINRLAFEGNRRIDDETLNGEVQLKPRTVYTQTRVQTDVARILELYRRAGRFAATVEPKVIQLEQNRVDLVFEITEGPLTGVQRIVFVGNRNFSDGTLREVIQTKQSRWWRFFSTTDSYDPDRLSFDRELLRRFYLKEGFADFRVTNAVAELTPDRSAFFITFTVEEGERYRFGDIDLVNSLPGFDPDTVREYVTTDSGDWYNAEEVEDTVQELTERIGAEGFAFVDVEPNVARRREDLAIDVTYQIAEGERIYVQRIDITGNVRTLDRVIRRNIRLAEGDAFNAARIRRSRTLIQNLGFFSRVDFNNRPGDAPDQTIVTVDVEEQSTGEITFGGGYSSIEGPTGTVGIRERNLLGRGQDLSLGFQISGVTQDIDLSFTEPYFLNRELAAGFDVFRYDREFINAAFSRRDLGFALRATYPLSEHLTQTLRYTLADQKIVPDVGASAAVREEAGGKIISRLDQSLLYDRRDSRIDPTEGYYGRWTAGFAGLGGDKHFLTQSVDAGYYYPFWDDWVASTIGQAGYVFPLLEDDTVDISNRFFLGGNSFRGFAAAGVGPRDVGDNSALGGKFLYTGTAEVAFPIGLPNELGVKGRLFTIAGGLTGLDNETATTRDTGSLRMSVGFGVSWASPFGPVRVDIAKAVMKEDFDDTELVSFGFGSAF